MAGPGVVITDERGTVPALLPDQTTFVTGVQIALERVYQPRADNPDVMELLYAVGDIVKPEDAERLNIVEGRVRLRDKADVAPTEKARRRAKEDKAERKPAFEDKAVEHDG